MEKKMYITPQTEALTFGTFSSIMITSVGDQGNNMPGEPGKSAPARHGAPVF